MQGPNKPVSDQLIREAKIGLTIIALLAGLFCYITWNRFSGSWDQTPEHVSRAPIAQNMNKEFREEHRLEMAKLSQPSNTQGFPKSPAINATAQNENLNPATTPIQRTFTQGRTIPTADSVSAAQTVPKNERPIAINDLRGANPSTPNPAIVQDNNVQPVGFTGSAPAGTQGFDDPFGPSVSTPAKLPTPDSNQNFAPRRPFKLSPQEASEFKPTTTQKPMGTEPNAPEEQTPTNPRNDLGGSGLNSNSFQPKVVMHSSSFQVQVLDEPGSQQPQIASAQENTERNTQFQQTNSIALSPSEHKPLTRAEDFASHSLHPPRPLRSPTNAQVVTSAPSNIQPVIVTKTKDQYTIQKSNETLWAVAQDVYGDGRLFRAVYELNRNNIPNPEKLDLGTKLLTPPLEELVQNFSNHVPRDLLPVAPSNSIHITAQGDTLFDIARQKLGQASRFNELIELNQGRLPQDISHLAPLSAGMKLDLPRQ